MRKKQQAWLIPNIICIISDKVKCTGASKNELLWDKIFTKVKCMDVITNSKHGNINWEHFSRLEKVGRSICDGWRVVMLIMLIIYIWGIVILTVIVSVIVILVIFILVIRVLVISALVVIKLIIYILVTSTGPYHFTIYFGHTICPVNP